MKVAIVALSLALAAPALAADGLAQHPEIQAAIDRELSGVTVDGTLAVALHDDGSATVTYTRRDGRVTRRTVTLPPRSDDAVETIALLAGNLVRDQADGLLPAIVPEPVVVHADVAPRTATFAFGLVPYVSTDQLYGEPMAHGFALHLVAGDSRGVRGASVSGAVDVQRGDVVGVQLAGAINISTGDVTGAEVAGAFNFTGANVRGVQVAGAMNVAGGLRGVQAAGGLNIAQDGGAQLAGAFNFARDNHLQLSGGLNIVRHGGGQLAGAMNFADSSDVQLAGGINWAERAGGQVAGGINYADDAGAQLAGGINYTGESRVLQLAPINVARRARGVQLGVVNYSDERDGLAIGVISIVRHGIVELDVGGSSVGVAEATLRHGRPRLYNLYGGAIDADGSVWMAGLGLGSRVYSQGNLDVDADVMGWHVDGEAIDADLSVLGRARLGAALGFGRVSVFAAAAVDVYVADDGEDGTALHPLVDRTWRSDDVTTRLWPTFSVGLRLR